MKVNLLKIELMIGSWLLVSHEKLKGIFYGRIFRKDIDYKKQYVDGFCCVAKKWDLNKVFVIVTTKIYLQSLFIEK